MEAIEEGLEAWIRAPFVTQPHAYVSESVAPRPRADEGVDVETELVHLRDPRGQRDEGADDGKHAPDKHRDRAVLCEEVVGHVEVALAQQEVAAVSLDHGATAFGADPVSGNRAEVRGQRCDGREDDEL